MPTDPQQSASIVETIFILFLGGGGYKILELVITRFFPSRGEKASEKKTDAEAGQIAFSSNLQAFQVTDESLRDWIKSTRSATLELLNVMRQLNQIEIICDDAIDLIGKCLDKMDECEVKGIDTIKKQFEEIKREREIMRERILHSTAPDPER